MTTMHKLLLPLFLFAGCVAAPLATEPLVEHVGDCTTLTTCPLPGETTVDLERRHSGVAVAYVAHDLADLVPEQRRLVAELAGVDAIAAVRRLAALAGDPGVAGDVARAALARLCVILAMR